MNILVTGADGFIGTRLIPELLAEGFAVSVLVRNKNKIINLKWQSEVTIFQADIRELEKVNAACINQNIIIHLAACAHVEQTTESDHWDIGYVGVQNILEAAIENKVKKLIFISSTKAQPRPKMTEYGKAKYQAELLLLKAHAADKIQVCCLRPAAVYGEGMKGNLASWIKKIKQGKAPPIPPVKSRIAMLGVDDLCRAVIQASASTSVNGKVYCLSDGSEYLIKQIETKIRMVYGKAEARYYFPKFAFYIAAILSDGLYRLFKIKTGFGLNAYQTIFGDEGQCSPEFGNEFEKDTGFKPKENFYNFIETELK